MTTEIQVSSVCYHSKVWQSHNELKWPDKTLILICIQCTCLYSSNWSLQSLLSLSITTVHGWAEGMYKYHSHSITILIPSVHFPSVLWHCWLGGRKGIRPVKNWVVGCWRGYLGWGAGLHMAQLMPLPLTISCSSKSRLVIPFLVLPFWYLLTRVVPDKFQKSSKTIVCVPWAKPRNVPLFTAHLCPKLHINSAIPAILNWSIFRVFRGSDSN